MTEAKRVLRVTVKDWLHDFAIARQLQGDHSHDWSESQWFGPTVSVAAERAGVSRQRIYQLLEQGTLEGIQLTDDDDNPVAFMVTESSLWDYMQSTRKPGPSPKA